MLRDNIWRTGIVGKFERLSWEELRERMVAVSGGPAHHSFTERDVSAIIAEALARVMERLDTPTPRRRAPKQRSPPPAP
jgi:hypothetical protein